MIALPRTARAARSCIDSAPFATRHRQVINESVIFENLEARTNVGEIVVVPVKAGVPIAEAKVYDMTKNDRRQLASGKTVFVMARAPGIPDTKIAEAHLAALVALSPVMEQCVASSGLKEDDIEFVTIPVLSDEYFSSLKKVLKFIKNCTEQGVRASSIYTVPEYEYDAMCKYFRILQICSGLGIDSLGIAITMRVESMLYYKGQERYSLSFEDLHCIFQQMGPDYAIRHAFIRGLAQALLDGKLDFYTRRNIFRRRSSFMAQEMQATIMLERLGRERAAELARDRELKAQQENIATSPILIGT